MRADKNRLTGLVACLCLIRRNFRVDVGDDRSQGSCDPVMELDNRLAIDGRRDARDIHPARVRRDERREELAKCCGGCRRGV